MTQITPLVPGAYLYDETAGDIIANANRTVTQVLVANIGDRPIQVGSHFHFFEVNPALAFDRRAAYGMRLHIPAGTAVRFEPGDAKTVELVTFGGHRVIRGHRGLVEGALDDPAIRAEALRRAGFAEESEGNA
jgi:urease subunit beta